MSKPLILRLKNHPENESPKKDKIDLETDVDESYSKLSPTELKQKLNYIQDSLQLIISEALTAISLKNEYSQLITYLKEFKKTIARLCALQDVILKLAQSKELIHELHNIFVCCSNYATIYICELKNLIHSKKDGHFQKMPSFLKMTLLKYGSLILLVPSINLAITKKCTDFKTLKSLMYKLIWIFTNFGEKLDRCVEPSTLSNDCYDNLWDGLIGLNFDDIFPIIYTNLNSMESTGPTPDNISLEEHKMYIMYSHKYKLESDLCYRLINIIYKFPEMLESVMENPHSHFIQMELIVTVFIFCVTRLLENKQEYNFIKIVEMISYFSDILIDGITGPNYTLETNFIQLNAYIETQNNEICTEICTEIKHSIQQKKEIESTKSSVKQERETAAAITANIAACMASIAVHSISECVASAISVAAELSLQHEYKLELTNSAITVAIRVSKSAAKSAFKAVRKANTQIKKIQQVSATAAYTAIVAASTAMTAVTNVNKIINATITKKKNDLIEESKKASQIIISTLITTALRSIINIRTRLSNINKVTKEAVLVAQNAAKSAKIAELKAYNITIWAATNRLAIHSINGIIRAAKVRVVQKGHCVKNELKNQDTCYKFICNKVKQLENMSISQKQQFRSHKRQLHEQKQHLQKQAIQITYQNQQLQKQAIQITYQNQQLQEQKQQSQWLNSQLYDQQSQIDYLFKCLQGEPHQHQLYLQAQSPPQYQPSDQIY